MKVILVTGEFPVRSQPFIFAKALSLARRGLHVELMASQPGNLQTYGSLMRELPANLTVRYAARTKDSLFSVLTLLLKASVRVVCFPREVIRLIILMCRHGRDAKSSAKQFMKLIPFIGCSADIIHFEFATKAVEMEPLLDFFRGKKVVSCRGTDVSIIPLTDEVFSDALHRVFEKADRVHCVSGEILTRALRYGLKPSKAFINHPAVDVNFFQPERNHASSRTLPVIISVGRLHWVKGYEFGLQALQILHEKGVRFRYQIVGAGPAEDAIRFAIWELGLTGVVELLKGQPHQEVKTHLNEADIFLLTSVSEGLSNTVLEAMAMELPVISSLAGGMSEAISDGTEGFLVKTRSPNMIAEKLEILLNDPELRIRMGKAARKRVLKQFSLERQTACFEEEYLRILESSTHH